MARQVVQGGKRLVEHQEFRLQDQGPRQRHALQLAARQFVGQPRRRSRGQFQQLQVPRDFFSGGKATAGGPAAPGRLQDAQRLADDLPHGEKRVHGQVRVLEHHLVAAAKIRSRRHGQGAAAVKHLAAVGRLECP